MPQDAPSLTEKHKITVFGCSHSVYFHASPFYYGRMGFAFPTPYHVVGKVIGAASVAGFRPGVSTLSVRQTILDALPQTERLILAFGQVDLELGYYYRLVIKQDSLTRDDYVAWLLGIYRAFLHELPLDDCSLGLKGVNLTALSPKGYAARYVSRIITENGSMGQGEAEKLLLPIILSEDEQNEMSLAFNRGLAIIAAEMGARYFDLNDRISNGNITGISAVPARLHDMHRVAGLDHHLADTVEVRKMHFEAAGKVFDLI